MSNRLTTIDAELNGLLETVGPSKQRDVAMAVTQAVVASSQLGADPRYAAISAHDTSDIGALVEALDNEYFQLQDLVEAGQASEERMLGAFNKARAANSILFISAGDYCEAIYEAFSATDETSEISLIARRTLGSSA
jgi:hypothetical protein